MDNLVNQEEAVDITNKYSLILLLYKVRPERGNHSIICYLLSIGRIGRKKRMKIKTSYFLFLLSKMIQLEHIASQMRNIGFMTLKIGKKENSVSPEDSLIGRIRNTVDGEIYRN